MKPYYCSCVCEDILYKMTAVEDRGIVGHLTMRFMDMEKEVLHFGFVIVNDAKRGKDYGKQILKLAIQYAFEFLRVDKITLCVFENNDSAINQLDSRMCK